jgi:uncharacterized protein (DUF427 family)
MQAIWNGQVVAESDKTIMVEGNHYFPPDSLRREYFKVSARHTTCPWKGVTSYYDVAVDGEVSEGGAWYYPEPKTSGQRDSGLCGLLARR